MRIVPFRVPFFTGFRAKGRANKIFWMGTSIIIFRVIFPLVRSGLERTGRKSSIIYFGSAVITRKDLFLKCATGRWRWILHRRSGKRNRGLRVDLCAQLITARAVDYLLAK